ncbi:hypothetical protein POM88_023927 [Heracleum sosnowskyi]|uniref:C2H2-type domain-containing protein n=1 Tax=Heracleum sosnowskyi TaxID=360622 RepID=A0AAD8MVE2_9APIA|nr:hypothetical protein POM88_023927 [Heracleum sosnowskyi]
MGLVGFLDFVLKCIQLLAWPSFALGYPLCASIRAIETNSDFYIRKLVAYWISFSLISLFEYTFSILLEWVPVWPYVKILTICWLVIPGFNGAIIAYDNIVHPCLSMQLPQIIVDMLNKKQNVSLTRESFLEDAEKYVKENGTEALEKLFSSKPIIDEPPVAQKDIKAGEILDKRVEAAENKDSSGPAMLSGYSWRQKETVEKQQITTVDTDIKVNNTTLTEKLTENAFLAPPALKNVQKEWTCAVCQVTTQSEANLNSHLQGMKHRTKCDELKAGKQTSIKKGVSTGTPNKERNCAISQPIIDEPPVAQKDIKAVEILDKRVEAVENKDSSGPAMLSGYSWRQKETVEKQQITTVDTDIKVNNTTLTEKLTENAFLAPPALKNVQKEWTCAVCQVTTQSEANLNSHLQGMKHRTKCEELKAGKQTAIKKGVSTGTPNKERNCAISQPIIDEPSVAQKDIKAVEILDKRVEAAENKVSLYVGSMLEILEKRVEAAGKQTAIKKGVSTGTPNKERNCAISQVTTQSKTPRTSLHQEFIEGKQTAIKNHSASTTIKSEQANRDLKNVSSDSGIKKVSCANQNPKQSSSGGGPNNKFDCDLCQVKLQSEATLKSHLQGTKHKSKSEQLKAREMTEKDKITSSTKYSDKNSSGLKKNLNAIAQVNIKANVSNGSHWCSICNVRCTSESDMASHLRGNRHLSMIKDSGHTRGVHYWCNICDVKCLSEKDMASHLNGKTHDSNLYESESD